MKSPFRSASFGYTLDQEVITTKKLFLLYTLFVFSLGYGYGARGTIPVIGEVFIACTVAFLLGLKVSRWFYIWKDNDFPWFGYRLSLTLVKTGHVSEPVNEVNSKKSTKTAECYVCNGQDVSLNGQLITCPACKLEVKEEDAKVVPIKKRRKVT